ncbi:phage integrase N-terminal SAM-like domain-containing protein [Sphingobium ummariense]|uniref:phage integrase N-terminal SAM-like domain-containing protein n=1 Tax=Sphingobium ummariense TaxID=420994 RepID=UPI001F01A125|nr:phage integrase N-terminal SAM-like domain-containing protein [Sphingobium ummariense]
MKLRSLGAHTQQDDIRHVRSFVAFLGRLPDKTGAEDLRQYQFDQHRRAVGPATINATLSALRFLFTMTLKRLEIAPGLSGIR